MEKFETTTTSINDNISRVKRRKYINNNKELYSHFDKSSIDEFICKYSGNQVKVLMVKRICVSLQTQVNNPDKILQTLVNNARRTEFFISIPTAFLVNGFAINFNTDNATVFLHHY